MNVRTRTYSHGDALVVGARALARRNVGSAAQGRFSAAPATARSLGAQAPNGIRA